MDVKKININQSEQTYDIASDIYDVSAHNNGAIFESLSALLSSDNLSTLIPSAVRCGGMSIRFIQSSDNKYVQYILMSNVWSTTESDWQGVDDEPTYGSDNLVKSGGVFSSISTHSYSTESRHEFALSDNNGNNIVTFDEGHFKTKNFDSKKTIEKVAEIGNQLDNISNNAYFGNAISVETTWTQGYYLKNDGNIDTSVITDNLVSDYINYSKGLAIVGGYARNAQGYILACVYNTNKAKIGTIFASQDAQEDGEFLTNIECWQYLDINNDNIDVGYTVEDIKYIRIQSKKEFNPVIYKLTIFDRTVAMSSSISNKKIAFFGGSYSSISYGTCFKAYLRMKYNCFVRTFGRGGAGFGINSCWYNGYPNGPEMNEGSVIWEQSIPYQIDNAIKYCEDNNIPDGFDYFILWASTNDFNTHIKGKGDVNYTLEQLQDKTQFSNADTQDGGIILSINKIREAFPKAKILFFGSLPFFSSKFGYDLDDTTKPASNVMLADGTKSLRTQTNTFKEFIDDQELICKKYHIPYNNQMEVANIDEWNYKAFYNPNDNYLHPLRQGFMSWINQQTKFITSY